MGFIDEKEISVNSEESQPTVRETEEQAKVVAEQTDATERSEQETCDSNTEAQQPEESTVGSAVPEEVLNELRTLFNVKENKLFEYIRFYRGKDESIRKLSKQLDQYRSDINMTMFKTPALLLINFLEENRRIIKGGVKNPTAENCKKDLGYFVQDFEDMMDELGIDYEKKLFNGRALSCGAVKSEVIDMPESEVVSLPKCEANDLNGLIEYVKECEKTCMLMLQNDAALDEALKRHIAFGDNYEMGVYQTALYPVIRKIIKCYEDLKTRVEEASATMDDENAIREFTACREKTNDDIREILSVCGVTADEFVSDVFDRKYQTIRLVVRTDNDELARTVANRVTACYMMGEKVIYQQKVDIYNNK